MAYTIKFKSSVLKDLKKIDKHHLQRLLDKIDNDLAEDPGKGKALSGEYKGLYSFRIGDYRVIYTILNVSKIVLILRIGHRKDIYNK